MSTINKIAISIIMMATVLVYSARLVTCCLFGLWYGLTDMIYWVLCHEHCFVNKVHYIIELHSVPGWSSWLRFLIEAPAIHLPHSPLPECSPGLMTVDDSTILLSCPHLPPPEPPVEHPGVDNELQEVWFLPDSILPMTQLSQKTPFPWQWTSPEQHLSQYWAFPWQSPTAKHLLSPE